jgi:hypothetical protein
MCTGAIAMICFLETIRHGLLNLLPGSFERFVVHDPGERIPLAERHRVSFGGLAQEAVSFANSSFGPVSNDGTFADLLRDYKSY